MGRTMGRKLTAHEVEVRLIISEWKMNTHSFIIERLAEENERARQIDEEMRESRREFQKWSAQWEDDTWS